MQAVNRAHVIVSGAIVRRLLVFADVDANAYGILASAAVSQVSRDTVRTLAVEAEPIDDRPLGLKAEQPWFRVARLRARRDGADFRETESERGPRSDSCALFVETSRETDGIAKLEAEHAPGEAVFEC